MQPSYSFHYVNANSGAERTVCGSCGHNQSTCRDIYSIPQSRESLA